MLGNLLDNACKWTKARIAVESSELNGFVVITVDDDGPGLAPLHRDKVLERGVRADEAAPGSGLGLAIVRDLAELYAGAAPLTESPAGGLQARLTLPKASRPARPVLAKDECPHHGRFFRFGGGVCQATRGQRAATSFS